MGRGASNNKHFQSGYAPSSRQMPASRMSPEETVITVSRAIADGVSPEEIKSIADWHDAKADFLDQRGRGGSPRHLAVASQLRFVAGQIERTRREAA